MAIQNDDLILVNRGGVDYKAKIEELPTGNGDVDLSEYAKLNDTDQDIIANNVKVSYLTATADIETERGYFIGDGSKLTNLPVGDIDLSGYALVDHQHEADDIDLSGYALVDHQHEASETPNLQAVVTEGGTFTKGFITARGAAAGFAIMDTYFSIIDLGQLSPESGDGHDMNSVRGIQLLFPDPEESSGYRQTIKLLTNGNAYFENVETKELTTSHDSAINGVVIGTGNSSPTGKNNTAIGYNSLPVVNHETGQFAGGISNTAIGSQNQSKNVSCKNNTSVGYYNMTSAVEECDYNVAVGIGHLGSMTGGRENIAIGGVAALTSANEPRDNIAIGNSCMFHLAGAELNTCIGNNILSDVSLQGKTVTGNIAIGYRALEKAEGSYNIALGIGALSECTSGNNIGIGLSALFECTGDYNIGIGEKTLYNTSGKGNIEIVGRDSSGKFASVYDITSDNNKIVFGHKSVTDAYVKVAWTVVSDARDKMNFASVPHGLDFVKQLSPTAYQFKVNRDTETPNGRVHYGFKAQDILALEGDSPVIIDNADPENLKYRGESLVPVLVNAIKEQQVLIEALTARLEAAGL